MREQIAVLDGLALAADGYFGRDYTPEPAGGANYIGGSNWYPGAPTLVSSEGLAGLGTLGADAVPGYSGGSYTPEPGGGQNYVGGSNWFPGAPTLPSSEGLAGSLMVDRVPGYAGETFTPVPGAGQNYTGGSDWFPGAPTRLPGEGLVGVRARARARRGLRAVPGGESPPWKFPMYDERELPVVRAIRCGVANGFRALFGVAYPGEVERNVQAIRMMLRRDQAAFSRAMGATRQENAYLGAYYVMSRAATDTYRGTESLRARALRASQMCG